MSASEELSRTVRARSQGRCQYCLMHESLQGATFHIEHVIPLCKGGGSVLENLTLACPGCNLRKGARITAVDPVTGQSSRFFHPNLQRWQEHFRFDEFKVEGLTAEGRTTIAALELNHSRRQRIWAIEKVFGLYPPLHR